MTTFLIWLSRLVDAGARSEWLREWRSELGHARELAAAGRARTAWRLRLLSSAIEDAVRTGARRLAPGPALQDVRFATRLLRKSPGFTVIAVATLALGIGANTAIFTLVNAVLLRPLAFPQADRIVQLVTWKDGEQSNAVSQPNFVDYRDQVASLEDTAATIWWAPVLQADEPTRFSGLAVSSGYFGLFATRPALGRYLQPGDDPLGSEPVVVVSQELWRNQLGGDPEVIGSSLVLDDVAHRVVGVAEPGLRDPLGQWQLWRNPPQYLEQAGRASSWLQVWGRLAPGTPLEQAQAEMDAVSAALEREYPVDNRNRSIQLVPMRERLIGDLRPVVLVLLGAVVLVLLIACANVANLLLTRGAAREREIAVRMSMGAGRARVARQLLTEGLLLAGAGAALGTWLGALALRAVLAMGAPGIPDWAELTLDSRVLAFTVLATVFTGVIFGLAPLRQVDPGQVSAVLREAGRGASASRRTRRIRSGLAVAEVALATVLLIGAGLVVRSFAALTAVDTGFQAEGVLTVSITSNALGDSPDDSHVAFFDAVRERLAAIPGVESVGQANMLPLTGALASYQFTRDDLPDPPPGGEDLAELRAVSPGYFETFGIPLIEGRLPSASDDQAAENVLFVNRTFARTFFPDESPVGKTLSVSSIEGSLRIAGMVGDVHALGPAVPPLASMYLLHGQRAAPYWMRSNATLLLRVDGEPMSVADSVREAIWEIDDSVAVDAVGPFARHLERYHAAPRFQAQLLGGFAILATLLAAIGVAAVLTYSVATRVHEIGVRRALGARADDIVRLVGGEVARLVGLGVGIGMLAGLLGTRALETMLFGVSATDPLTFVAAPALIAAVAVASAMLPARRASRVDPAVALRQD